MNQKGIGSVLILIAFAAIFVIGAIAYGFWITTSPKKVTSVPAPETTSESIIRPQNTACPDTDYTGCDTSSDFMTWTDDGERNPESQSTK